VTLSRLEKVGLVEVEQVGQQGHPDKKVYDLTSRSEPSTASTSRSRPAPPCR
jgi:Transcriptional regulator PadR-like family